MPFWVLTYYLLYGKLTETLAGVEILPNLKKSKASMKYHVSLTAAQGQIKEKKE
jgi:hypothetical protein